MQKNVLINFILFPMELHKNHEVNERASYKAICYECCKAYGIK